MTIISTQKRLFTEYGIAVKTALLSNGRTQEWLISEIKKVLPDMYIDSSNLYKILTGQLNSKKIIGAINEILHISDRD